MAQHIVVGVDDSAGAREAVAWAMREADLRQAELEAVHSWSPSWAEGFNTQWAADRDELDREAKEMMAKVIADARAETGSVVEPKLTVVCSPGPGQVLVARSAPADLLVVGSRGHGGFVGLALGSVSTVCVHHAQCPVVVVRPHRAERPAT